MWKDRSKICTCFETAKLAVDINHSREESSAFVLYTADHEIHNESHSCQIYGNFQLGRPVFQKEKPYLWDKAPATSGFVGQTNLKYQLIKNFFSYD